MTNLNGVPIKSGNVIARSDDLVEQAVITSDGSFRIKGLHPLNSYTLTVESDVV